MLNNQKLLRNLDELPASVEPLMGSDSIRLFSSRIKSLWLIMILLTCTAGLIPIGTMPFLLFYFYYGIKVAAFFALGFLSPLAFRRLNGIGLGLIFSLLSAFLIESFQSLSHNGHSFHWHELAGKFALVSLGFALALERRYQQQITFGSVAIKLRANTL